MRPLRYIAELLVLGLLANWVPAQGQTVPPETPTSSAQAPAERLQPETVEAYRSAIQAELETVVKSDLTKEELEKARAPYDDMLRLLVALDAAWQQQLRYTTQLAQLPDRFREVTATAEKLKTRPLEQFDTVTEDLRDQYEAHVQATQNEIQEILKQTSAGEAGLVAIPKELEQAYDQAPGSWRNALKTPAMRRCYTVRGLL